jgi:WD40 repeat protein
VDFGATATQAALNLFATQTAAAFTAQPPTPTPTAAPPAVASETPTPKAAPLPQGEPQFIAYVRDEQLVVTDVTNGVQGGTTQYTVQGESDKVRDIVWSPSGEFVSFVSAAQGDPHVFYIFALGQSSPTDLGPGSSPAWSPDSQSLAFVGGTYPDENVWVTSIENPAPRQLTFETNYAWGRPAFTPDGQALIVAGADRFYMGAQGNTMFTLERLALDGSGTRTPLPGAASVDGSRLPYDLYFSPDGSRLAYSTSMHISACASLGAYYVSSPDGGNRAEYISPSLKELVDPGKERYFVGLNYAWSPTSNALVIAGTVVDCDPNSPTMGQVIGGPQISLLQLDGITEGPIIPGRFFGLSMDRTGTLIAGANYMDLQSPNASVEIYSAQSGQLVLSLGPGNSPQLQP